MKLLLIRPGNKIEDSKHVMLPPLGLLYLGSVLENDGHKVEILDYSVLGLQSLPQTRSGARRKGHELVQIRLQRNSPVNILHDVLFRVMVQKENRRSNDFNTPGSKLINQ